MADGKAVVYKHVTKTLVLSHLAKYRFQATGSYLFSTRISCLYRLNKYTIILKDRDSCTHPKALPFDLGEGYDEDEQSYDDAKASDQQGTLETKAMMALLTPLQHRMFE